MTPRIVKQAAWMNTVPAVILNIQRQPGANIITVVDKVKALLPRLQSSLPGLGEGRRADGSHHHDSGFGAGRGVRTAADDRAGGDGHLSVPAQSVGDDHPQRRGSALAGRNLRRDVSARLQPQQPHPDGADDLDRFRRRRRDRDDREHRALYRGRRDAARGRA